MASKIKSSKLTMCGGIVFMKGSKRNRWLKDGMKVSRRLNKKMWVRRVRRTKDLHSGGYYKRLAGVTMYDGVL